MSDWRDNLPAVRGKLVRDEPLAPFTWLRVGGPADVLFLPQDAADLADFLKGLDPEVPVTPLGVGSNTLVRDGGVDGVVIRLGRAFATLEPQPESRIRAGAAALDAQLARAAGEAGIGKLEFYSGIPGTVGGALAMNAGCYGSETWAYVERVRTIDRRGTVRERTRGDYDIGYRHCALKSGSDEWFLGAWFRFRAGDGTKARARIRELLAQRIATQPLNLPNAGSVFRNPEGDHAARLVEACGLKGFAIGGARISEKHANFIVNPGGKAKAADIEALITHARQAVKDRFGIELVPEVRIIGEAA